MALKCSKSENNLDLTLVLELIFHKLQELGHPNFVWHFDLHLTPFSQSMVSEIRMVLKCSKSEKMWIWPSWVDISHITRPRASKFCMTLWHTFSKIFPKYGVWDKNGVEMLKVGKNVNLTLVHGLISHTLQDLGHRNFVWYFDLHLVRFSRSLVCQIRMMQKCPKW